MAFWTDSLGTEPKRQFRFKVIFPGMPDGGVWYARSATKPTFTVSQSEHKFLNHTFYYPGKVTWNTSTISFADPANPDATGGIMRILASSGYRIPDAGGSAPEDFRTMGKKNSVNSLGDIQIIGLNENGEKNEVWTLHNAFVVGLTLNDYSYESEDLSTVDVELRYDWAGFSNKGTDYAGGGRTGEQDGGITWGALGGNDDVELGSSLGAGAGGVLPPGSGPTSS